MPECYNCDGYFSDDSDNSSGKCKDCRGIGKCSYCGVETDADLTEGCERCGYGDGFESAFVCTDCSMANTCGICDEMGSWCCMPRKYYEGGGYSKNWSTNCWGNGTPVVGRPTECCGSYFCDKGDPSCDSKHHTKKLECGHIGCNMYPELFTSGKGVCRTCDKIMDEKVDAAGKQE